MIKVQIFRNAEGAITGFSVTGHANAGPHGQDIVCAAVSVLAQTAVLGLEGHLRREFKVEQVSGKLNFELIDRPDELSGAILETMVIGLTDIAQNYPQSVRIAEHRR